MTRWAMVADLERCVGCQTCTAACRHANATSPAVQWRKVLDVEAGSFPSVNRTFVPVGCQHCADPPCMHVCPSTATRQRPDGIVTIDYDICIGCAYCDVACPYQARFLVHEPHFAYGPAMQNEVERFDDRRIGVAQKCTYCSDRIDFGVENGLTPGRDPRATPACVNACIADALIFGDVEDPYSNVSVLLREQRHFRMHEEVGTEPSFYYVTGKADGAPDALPTAAMESQQAQPHRVRTRGVEPWHQQHWNWKAAGNFLCGGAGTGLLTFVALTGLAQAPVLAAGLAALAIVAFGLFLLIFKIGRPFRFVYVLRQPQRSWMSREAWVAGAFFPVALASLWFDSRAGLLVAALLGIGFMVCQAMMFHASKGIPAWRARSIVPLVMATGFAEGSGLFLLIAAFVPGLQAFAMPIAAALVLLVAVRHVAWRNYLGELARTGAPTRTLEIYRAFAPWFLVVGLIAPLWLVASGFVAPGFAPLLFALAGIAALVAGWAFKMTLITRAGFNQGFALKHTPVRGYGAAGPAVKPGWTMLRSGKSRQSNDRHIDLQPRRNRTAARETTP
ncbi:MAG: DmsC/YnfH family molybdoenzyme membrane anchor subunit [Xanthobacteraceae bacterium]